MQRTLFGLAVINAIKVVLALVIALALNFLTKIVGLPSVEWQNLWVIFLALEVLFIEFIVIYILHEGDW